MEKVRVLQGHSILEGGIWYNQGQVLMVKNHKEHVVTVRWGDKMELTKEVLAVEPVGEDVPVNVSQARLPKAEEAPAPPVPEAPAAPVRLNAPRAPKKTPEEEV